MCYSNVQGTEVGFYGDFMPIPSRNVHSSNFAVTGKIQRRCDFCAVNGIGAALTNSSVPNVKIEHLKVDALAWPAVQRFGVHPHAYPRHTL
jgi:hypothetical protein